VQPVNLYCTRTANWGLTAINLSLFCYTSVSLLSVTHLPVYALSAYTELKALPTHIVSKYKQPSSDIKFTKEMTQ